MTARTPVPSPSRARWGAASSRGHRRPANEDAHLAGPTWFLVADGMGGRRAGDIASAVAVGTFAGAPMPTTGTWTVDDVVALIGEAHAAIRSRASSDDTVGMATTLVGAIRLHPAGTVAVFHVGDCRCYRLIDGRLSVLTRDHSHVQDLVDAGRLDADAVAHHPMRNVVTRALGVGVDPGPEVAIVEGRPGRLLLCSDGLWGELPDRTIGRVLAGVAEPPRAAERLVELVLAGPARDDVTALVVDFDGAHGPGFDVPLVDGRGDPEIGGGIVRDDPTA